jgi:hypothetical protein
MTILFDAITIQSKMRLETGVATTTAAISAAIDICARRCALSWFRISAPQTAQKHDHASDNHDKANNWENHVHDVPPVGERPSYQDI